MARCSQCHVPRCSQQDQSIRGVRSSESTSQLVMWPVDPDIGRSDESTSGVAFICRRCAVPRGTRLPRPDVLFTQDIVSPRCLVGCQALTWMFSNHAILTCEYMALSRCMLPPDARGYRILMKRTCGLPIIVVACNELFPCRESRQTRAHYTNHVASIAHLEMSCQQVYNIEGK